MYLCLSFLTEWPLLSFYDLSSYENGIIILDYVLTYVKYLYWLCYGEHSVIVPTTMIIICLSFFPSEILDPLIPLV